MPALPSEHYAVLSLYLILLLHKIVDRLLIINDIKITMNSVLDNRGSHCKINNILRLHLLHKCIDKTTCECIPAAAAACSVVPAALGEALGDIAALSVASL